MADAIALDGGRDHFNAQASRRKSSAAVVALERAKHDPVDIVEDIALLDEADRRLAELGYVQVRSVHLEERPDQPANQRTVIGL